MITGLSHMTFIVKNLERSSLFFKNIFDAKEVYSSGNETFSLSREKLREVFYEFFYRPIVFLRYIVYNVPSENVFQ